MNLKQANKGQFTFNGPKFTPNEFMTDILEQSLFLNEISDS